MLYYALIYLLLHYGITVWGGNYKTRLSGLTILQKRAARFILDYPPRSNISHLFPVFKLLNIHQIHIFKTLCLTYKFTHRMLPPLFDDFL